ncbi:acylphosphatase [Oceanobacillus oncorhynchi]|uniref:acylphosphatase n=1 Tax=Oceanobacillus oncorhynchi TaxID=545501 RepID=UPI00186672E6|nr:acylphosphatase [Oceanobacillus oncorhynchi]
MKSQEAKLLPSLPKKVVENITGFQLCSYLIALEGWRRGLELKYYRDETPLCELSRLNSSTHGKFCSLSNGSNKHYFFRSRGDKVSNQAVSVCENKEETKSCLQRSNVPIPLGKTLKTDEDIINYANEIGYPVIIKPLNGSMGRGVYINISNSEELSGILKEVRKKHSYRQYIVEKHYNGEEYRMYVVGDKVIGATNRIPANVIGDGINTIEKLIEFKNNERKKNPYLSQKPIKIDYEVTYMLERAGYNLESIPDKGEHIFLREKSNLSSGGDPIEATDEISEEVKQIAVNALQALPSIPHAGVDIIVDPKDNRKGVVLEVNATAEISFHLFPLVGKAKDIPGAIIDYYFPETVGQKKSMFYFDYLSLLVSLKAHAIEEVKVIQTPLKEMFAKKYIVEGTVNRVGYMTFIKKEALKENLFGYAKKIGKNKIEIYLLGEDKEVIEKFRNKVKKGSKRSVVKNIEEQNMIYNNKPRKTGFKIIS